MTIGEYARGHEVLSTIDRYALVVDLAAERFDVDPDLIRAIIYEEQTHLLPGERVAEYFGIGTTVGLGQISEGYYGYTREQLLDPVTNIQAIAQHLSALQKRPLIDPSDPTASLATRYNFGGAVTISPYGRRVGDYYESFSSGF